jgi:hypothetical protein
MPAQARCESLERRVATHLLIVPLTRVAGRCAQALRAAFAVSGIGLAALSLAGLFISEESGLFGFVEHGYRTAIVLAIVAEVAAIVFLLISSSRVCASKRADPAPGADVGRFRIEIGERRCIRRAPGPLLRRRCDRPDRAVRAQQRAIGVACASTSCPHDETTAVDELGASATRHPDPRSARATR